MPKTTMSYPFKIKGSYPTLTLGNIQDNWRKAADEKGFVVLGLGGEKRQTLVLGCQKCGEPLLRRSSVVLHSKKIDCRSCIRKPYDAAAARLGASVIGRVPGGGRHERLLMLNCGHSKMLRSGQINKVGQGANNVDCEICRYKRYDDEARLRGWRYLRPSDNRAGYGVYRHKCGVEHEISVGNMKTGRCSCPKCKKSRSAKPSGIYIFKIDLPGQPVIKLGHSGRFEDRLHYDLKIDKNVHTEVLRFHPMPSAYLARTQEKAAHKTLRLEHPDWVVPKRLFGDAIAVKSEIYRPEALAKIHRLLDEIAVRHPAASSDSPAQS